MKVRDVMTPEVGHCGRDANLADAAMIMWRHDCGVVPVVDPERRVNGIITDRDICMAVATRHRRPEELSVGLVISNGVHTVRPEADIRSALELMKRHQIRRLPVTDERGVLLGMLSISDLVLRSGASRRATDGEVDGHEILEAMKRIVRRAYVPEHAAAS